MATVEVGPKYREFVSELMREFRARDVLLSDYAEGLLYLSAEAWFEEPPLFRKSEYFKEQEMQAIARTVVNTAFEDDHIRQRLKKGGRVKYFDLLSALSDSGKKVLADLLAKGF